MVDLEEEKRKYEEIQKEVEKINTQVDELRKNNLYLELYQWWGFKYAGKAGIIITTDDEIYEYEIYNNQIPEVLKDVQANYFKKIGNLSSQTKQKIENYIEEKIKDKEFPSVSKRDGGSSVKIYTKNIDAIVNYDDIYKELKEIINSDRIKE